MKMMKYKKVLNLSCVTEDDVKIVEHLMARAVSNRRSVSAEAFVALEFYERFAPPEMLDKSKIKVRSNEEVSNG